MEFDMTFVYERIPEADSQRLNDLKICIGGHRLIQTDHVWTINRELDAFMIWGYPEREPPHETWYIFWWKGQLTEVAIVEKPSGRTQEDYLIGQLEVMNIIPPQLILQNPVELNELLIQLKIAIEVDYRGEAKAANWKPVAEVCIQFPSKIPTSFGLFKPYPESVDIQINHLNGGDIL
jgi:hypothetical protein